MCPICSINLNNFITPIPYNYIPPKKAQSQQAHCGLAESMLQPLLSHNSCQKCQQNAVGCSNVRFSRYLCMETATRYAQHEEPAKGNSTC